MTERVEAADGSVLFMEERQRAIHDLVNRNGKVAVDELALRFAVSAPTIRSDLARLEEQGLLRRTHGGAIPASPTLFEPPYAQRQVIRHAEKRAIARLAAELVQPGETILLDAGTTTYEAALALRESTRLTVVTNSLANAQALMDSPGIEVVLIGGVVQPRRRAILGPLATRFLEQFHVDRAFLAFNGVHADAGFTVVDFEAAELKRRMLGCADTVVVLSDSGKLGQIAFARVAPLSSAHLLVTDLGADPAQVAAARECGVEVRLAE